MNNSEREHLLDHLYDLQDQSERYYCKMESNFLNEEEQAIAKKYFIPSDLIRYEGGYPTARKKKVIFSPYVEDDFLDIVVIKANIDQRFVKIEHRDVLGALMNLGIDRNSFGDFMIQEDAIYIYTSESMGRFLCDNLFTIHKLNVRFKETKERPEAVYLYKDVRVIVSSLRLDALVSALSHKSRQEGQNLIEQGLVCVDHVVLYEPCVLCNNNSTISIRGCGRFELIEIEAKTRKDRLVVHLKQSVSSI